MANNCVCSEFVADRQADYHCKSCGRSLVAWQEIERREQAVWKATDPTLPQGATCEVCGEWVNLESLIIVTLAGPDGTEEGQMMSEAAARRLLGDLGLPQPPVICSRHVELPAWVSQEYPVAN